MREVNQKLGQGMGRGQVPRPISDTIVELLAVAGFCAVYAIAAIILFVQGAIDWGKRLFKKIFHS